MLTTISDNPVPTAGIIGTFVAALLALLVSFGVPITQAQAGAILAFVAALYAVLTFVASHYSVPKTPSGTGSGTLQVPPPGTVLVTTAAAEAPAPVPAGSIVASATTPVP